MTYKEALNIEQSWTVKRRFILEGAREMDKCKRFENYKKEEN